MRIGLAMSGGGVRGLAHIGVIQALRERGIEVEAFSGVSAGGLVGVMAAAGCSTKEMLDFWTETDPLSIRNVALGEPSFFSTLNYIEPIKQFVHVDTFEDLQHRLYIGVTAMLSGKFRIFDSGPLWPIVLASAAFPIVFSPVEWEGELYMDGGIIDNFPVESLRQNCDFVIGVNVDPHHEAFREDLESIRGIIERVMDLRYHADQDEKSRYCDLLITPPGIERYGVFQTTEMLDIFQLGYESGKMAASKIDSLLKQQSD